MGKKNPKSTGGKLKLNTNSSPPVTEITEKPIEEKPASPVAEGPALGDRRLQLQLAKQAREEEEMRIFLEQKAKNNSDKKKNNKKSTPRAQKINEPKSEPKSQEPKDKEYVSHKMDSEPEIQTHRSSSGGWSIQKQCEEFTTQCNTETPTNDQVNNSEENWDTEPSPKDHPVIKRDFNSEDWGNSSFNTNTDNPEPNPKRGWGKRHDSHQNPDKSWGDWNADSGQRTYGNKSNTWQKNRSDDQIRGGNHRGDRYFSQRENNDRDGGKPRLNEPNYGSQQDSYSKFAPKRKSYDNSRGTRQSYGYSKFDGYNDTEFQEFLDLSKQRTPISYGKLHELKGDLFTASEDFSLAHCVAEDMSMGAGIAKTFRSKFGDVGYLLSQRQRTGGVAILETQSRFIYYLVTKQQSRGKPTLYTLWMSLKKLKQHIQKNNVNKLAIPQIGCGLDRLDWRTVKQMLEYIFHDVDIEIVVYIWDETVEDPTPTKLLKKCTVVHNQMRLIDIESQTGLVYFGSVDGYETEEYKSLASKFNIPAYKGPKMLHEVIKTVDRGEYIYGLIVKKNYTDEVNYIDIEKTLKNLNKVLKKDKTYYIGFQAFIDEKENYFVDKIISLMQYIFLDVQIWVCWPDELKEFCPQPKAN